MSHASHEHKAHAPRSLRFAILTMSDTRTPATDASGDALERLARAAGHDVVDRSLLKDDLLAVERAVRDLLGDAEVDVVVTTGGTGIAPRDVTIEAVEPLLEKRLPGFGELFRAASVAQVGTAALATRAEAGVARGKLVFLLPGSPEACALAMEKLILPEAPHLVGLLRR
jgi:molybdenum cofactor biosynthesis protein B